MRALKISQRISQKDGETLNRYMKEVSAIKLLTPEEEKELALKLKNYKKLISELEGIKINRSLTTEEIKELQINNDAYKRLVDKFAKANLRFVISVAKQYQNNGVSLEDLINEGNFGLIKAIEKFEPERDLKFISYAVWWIRQSILQSLAENSRIVRLPANKLGDLYKINRAVSNLEQEFEREPTTDEIGEKLNSINKNKKNNITGEDVNLVLSSSYRSLSLDAPVGSDEDTSTLLDLLPSGDTYNFNNAEDLKIAINEAVEYLPEKEKFIIRKYYSLDGEGTSKVTLEDIASELMITKERVRQIAEKALRRLRCHHKARNLRKYLHD